MIQKEIQKEESIAVKLNIPKGYLHIAKVLAELDGCNNIDEFIRNSLVESIDLRLEDPQILNQELKAHLKR